MQEHLLVFLKTTEKNMTKLVQQTIGQQKTLGQFNILMDHTLQAMDMLSQKLEELAPLTQKTACKMGCGLCCSNITVVSQPYFVIHSLNTAKSKKGIYEYAQSQNKAGSSDCYFLKNGVCTNYDVRPSACRTFYAFDTEECKKGNFLRKNRISNHLFAFIDSGLKQGFLELGIDCTDVSFNKAMATLMKNDRAVEDWLNGKPIFQNCYIMNNFESTIKKSA